MAAIGNGQEMPLPLSVHGKATPESAPLPAYARGEHSWML